MHRQKQSPKAVQEAVKTVLSKLNANAVIFTTSSAAVALPSVPPTLLNLFCLYCFHALLPPTISLDAPTFDVQASWRETDAGRRKPLDLVSPHPPQMPRTCEHTFAGVAEFKPLPHVARRCPIRTRGREVDQKGRTPVFDPGHVRNGWAGHSKGGFFFPVLPLSNSRIIYKRVARLRLDVCSCAHRTLRFSLLRLLPSTLFLFPVQLSLLPSKRRSSLRPAVGVGVHSGVGKLGQENATLGQCSRMAQDP